MYTYLEADTREIAFCRGSRYELIEKRKQSRQSYARIANSEYTFSSVVSNSCSFSPLFRLRFSFICIYERRFPSFPPRFIFSAFCVFFFFPLGPSVFPLDVAHWLFAHPFFLRAAVRRPPRFTFAACRQISIAREPIFTSLIELISETELQIYGTTLSSFTSFHFSCRGRFARPYFYSSVIFGLELIKVTGRPISPRF